MYNGIQKIEDAINYIEKNITSNLDCEVLARKMSLSVYEFRRIFSFLVGCPISEYIRKRRLSLAAIEIMTNPKTDILKTSEKYGYSNQSAFSRAFFEQHGVSPTDCMRKAPEINLFTCPKFEMHVSGRDNVAFKILETNDFFIKGFLGVSTFTDTCCCENVWNEFYEKGFDKKLSSEKIYVLYSNEENNVKCCIGEIATDGVKIPTSKWACFKLNTTDDEEVNKTYSKILYEWLPSANLKKIENMPIIEVFPLDMSEDGFEWEIRIPIEKE